MTAQIDIMKIFTIIVTNVILNVHNVLDPLEIVTHVTVTEKTNHPVPAQMELMKPIPPLVHHVLPFVELV